MNDGLFSGRHLFIFLLIAFLLATTVAAVALDSPFQLLTPTTTTATTASPSGMEIITSNGPRELTLLRGCATDQLLKITAGGNWRCADDSTTTATGVGVVVLDLSDDGVNESAAIGEIATVGDTNSIFSEPSADKLLITLSNDWPKADLADALAANPTDCAANNFAIAIVANGNLTCAQVNFTDLAGTATDAQIPNTITIDLAALATALAANGANCSAGSAPLGVDASGAAEGCFDVEEEAQIVTTAVTGNAVAHGLFLGTGASTATWSAAVPHCPDSSGQHINYNTGTKIFSCGTSGDGAGGYATVQDEGSGLTQRTIVNFIGATVECVDNAGSSRTDCTISAGGSTNSFETWDTPDGTDIVADSATDTVTITAGGGLDITGGGAADTIDFDLDSSEADFLASGALTCGAGTQGRIMVHTTPLQYCDNDGGDTLRYSAYGDSSGVAVSATTLAANGANCGAGNAPLGVDAAGAVESCFDVEEEAQIGTTNITGNAADDQILLGSAASAATWVSVGACAGGNQGLTYSATGNAVGCNTFTAGRSLTYDSSGNIINADLELVTVKKSINILNPTTGETNKVQFEYPLAATITEVSCSVDTGTLTLQFDERVRATPNTAGTNVLTSSLVCDTDTETTSTFSNAGIAADVPVNLQITGTSGTPTIVRIHVEATMDD